MGHRIRSILRMMKDILMMSLIYMPGSTGIKLRYLYYRKRFKKCGNNVVIDQGVIIRNAENISVGDNVNIDRYCIVDTGKTKLENILRKRTSESYQDIEGELIIGNDIHIAEFSMIIAHGGVLIGDRCCLSAGTKIYSLSNMAYDPDNRKRVISILPYGQAHFLMSPIVLDENVWIGLNGILLPGTHIGKNSFVVSNSLVKDIFPENSYISGQPAEKIRERFTTGD